MTAKKNFLLPLLHFIVDIVGTVGTNLLLDFLAFDRLRTPVTVEADILSSLIVF